MSDDIAAAPETADPTALSLALSGASREEADAFLRDQRPAAGLEGDYQTAVKSCGHAATLPDVAGTHIQARLLQLPAFAGLHDGAGVRDAYAELPPVDNPGELVARTAYEAWNEFTLGHAQALMDRRVASIGRACSFPTASTSMGER
jgi:hypothetical protein